MKKKSKLDTCRYLGHEVNWSQTWWCNKQFAEPTEVHKKCDCSNCPDFEAMEWIMESTENVLNNDEGFDYEPYTSMVLEGDYDL